MQTKYSLTIKNKSIMKFKVTKKEKELYEKLWNLEEEFENNEETLLSLYALGNNLGGSVFTGESWKLTQGFYEILKKGMNKDNDNDDFNTQIACSILDAIAELAHEHSDESSAFAKFLAEIYQHAIEENGEEYDFEIEVTDENDEPTEKKEETFEELAAKLDKMGYYVSKKPHKTSNKQPKKDK